MATNYEGAEISYSPRLFLLATALLVSTRDNGPLPWSDDRSIGIMGIMGIKALLDYHNITLDKWEGSCQGSWEEYPMKKLISM